MIRNLKQKRGRILLQFYSVKNFGDDMFVKIFADKYSEYDVILLCNPLHIPQWLPDNVHVASVSSWLISINKKLAKVLGQRWLLKKILGINQWITERWKKRCCASAIITGSLYMDFPNGNEKVIDFYIDPSVERSYGISSRYTDNGGDFIIGANIGPIYHSDFVTKVEQELESLNHICLRDYASYSLINNKTNVGYAPDVLFSLARYDVKEDMRYADKIMISVINLQYQRMTEAQKTAYFQLIENAILAFGPENCCLVSFCKKEGDEDAVKRVLESFEEPIRSEITYLLYEDNPDEILSAFKSCRFVISTRFHSMILAAVFNKKMYPISYNCKIENYLSDLQFTGNYARLDRIEKINVNDILQNEKKPHYYNNTKHIQYVDNQFHALDEYLEVIRGGDKPAVLPN